ncbi:MAG: lytic transglycosylase domain-containing protein, partial [Aquificota bacterium]
MLVLLLLLLASLSLAKLPEEYRLLIEYRQTRDPKIAYRILREYPDAVFKDDLIVLLAKDRASAGNREEARRLLEGVNIKRVKEDYKEDLLDLWKSLGLDKKRALLEDPVLFREFIPQVQLSSEQAISVANTLYRYRYYRDVANLLERVDFEKACYLLGISKRALGNREDAIEVLKACPDPRAKEELAIIYFYQNNKELLEEELSKIKDRQVLSNALLRLARIAISRGNYASAVEYLLRMEDGYDKFFYLGLSYFAMERYDKALESFLASLHRAQRDEERSASSFWVYKCKVELGHQDADGYLVKASNGAGFYYAVASKLINLPVASKALRVVVEDSAFPKTAQVIKSIHEAGFPYYARLEAFKRLGDISPPDVLAIRRFDPYLAIRLAVRKYGYGSMVYNMVAFPKPYKNQVLRASELYGVDP